MQTYKSFKSTFDEVLFIFILKNKWFNSYILIDVRNIRMYSSCFLLNFYLKNNYHSWNWDVLKSIKRRPFIGLTQCSFKNKIDSHQNIILYLTFSILTRSKHHICIFWKFSYLKRISCIFDDRCLVMKDKLVWWESAHAYIYTYQILNL